MRTRLLPLVWFAVFSFGVAQRSSAENADNQELAQIYAADQRDRQPAAGEKLDWSVVAPRDKARKSRVREMIDQGLLQTGKDFQYAAMVFQHGDTAEDILMAHVLAVTGVGKGNKDALWLAAASLDRFLQRVGRPQVFGTQFSYRTENGKQNWTMDPYDRVLVPAALRDANCVPDHQHQADTLEALSAGKEPQEPERRPCATR